jgi:hypothetical protein
MPATYTFWFPGASIGDCRISFLSRLNYRLSPFESPPQRGLDFGHREAAAGPLKQKIGSP